MKNGVWINNINLGYGHSLFGGKYYLLLLLLLLLLRLLYLLVAYGNNRQFILVELYLI